MPWVNRTEYEDLQNLKGQNEYLQDEIRAARAQCEIVHAVNRRQEEEIAELKVVLHRERSRLDAILLDAPSLEASVMKKLLEANRVRKPKKTR